MVEFELSRRLIAELLGTAFLVCTVVGSGIMAETLTGDVGLQLLGNTIPTGAILVVLITIFGPISGAHFNPAVTFAFAIKGEHKWVETLPYMIAQILGGVMGTFTAHLMFAQDVFQASTKVRSGGAQWFSEGIAAFGLVLLIFLCVRFRKDAVALLVGLYITAAYWFTASTSFANPAVAIARAFSDSFAGIRAIDVPMFIVAQFVGAILATVLAGWLLARSSENT